MSWDPVWEEIFKSRSWGQYPAEDLIRFVAVNFYKAPDRSRVKLLEVGCGPGPNLWYMAREGFAVYGIDGSSSAIQQAEARLNKECPGWKGELRVGDIKKLPYTDGFFDGVIDHEAVSCNDYESSKKIYREMARVTKKGGKMFSRPFADVKNDNREWMTGDGPLAGKGHVRFTEEKQIADLAQGFRITHTEFLTRSVENRRHSVQEWLILGEKK